MDVDRLVGDVFDACGAGKTVRRRRRRVLDLVGRRRLSRVSSVELQTALEERGVFPRPRLTVSGLSGDTWIRFSSQNYAEWEADHRLIRSHQQLVDHLVEWHPHIDEMSHLKLMSVERQIAGTSSRPDLVFLDRDADEVVVCEVKSGSATDRVVGQLHKYLRAMEPVALADGRAGVRGLLITSEPSAPAVSALELVGAEYPVDWFCYSTALRLHRSGGPGR